MYFVRQVDPPSTLILFCNMICFPNAKINIGLEVIRKRADNYHDLATLFYPVQLCDILEINRSDNFTFTQTGILLDSDDEQNLVVKAFRLLKNIYGLTNVNIHLHKQIPFGAGLGGGSSDAAFTLIGLNELFDLKLSEQQLLDYAAELGSDCPFFVVNRPVLASGKGDQFTAFDLNLKTYTLVLVKPRGRVTTAEAYGHIIPSLPNMPLSQKLNEPIERWKDHVINRFEYAVFPLHPEIEELKSKLYEFGAVYAAMSGSGSAVFGLFDKIPGNFFQNFPDCFCWQESCRY